LAQSELPACQGSLKATCPAQDGCAYRGSFGCYWQCSVLHSENDCAYGAQWCQWNGSSCVETPCNQLDQSACYAATDYCAWINEKRTCEPTSLAKIARNLTNAIDELHTKATQSLGDYIVSFAASNLGQYVHYQSPTKHECWDLAEAAIAHARQAGFNVPQQPSNLVFSNNQVNPSMAQPGNIAQFDSWSQTLPSGEKEWIDGPHTAILKSPTDGGKCWEVYEQNPDPVSVGTYCFELSHTGSVKIYQLSSADILSATIII